MKAKVVQYFNEIVSLIVMGLMIAALVAGQASGATEQASHAFEDKEDRVLLAKLEFIDPHDAAAAGVVIDVDLKIRPQGE